MPYALCPDSLLGSRRREATVALRLFTLDEALALLPTVRLLLAEIQAGRREVEARSAALERLLAGTGGNGTLAADVARARAGVEEAANTLRRLMSELDDLGVQLKDIDEGLVDF